MAEVWLASAWHGSNGMGGGQVRSSYRPECLGPAQQCSCVKLKPVCPLEVQKNWCWPEYLPMLDLASENYGATPRRQNSQAVFARRRRGPILRGTDQFLSPVQRTDRFPY